MPLVITFITINKSWWSKQLMPLSYNVCFVFVKWKYNIVCLQQTKMEKLDKCMVRSLCWGGGGGGGPFVDWVM
jgi:hypothetical protein